MRGILVLLAWVMSQGQGQGDGGECGGVLIAHQGVLQTPYFPRKFAVPLRCRWVIDASQMVNNEHLSIVVYFTQLFVSSGLTFTEFDYYERDSTFQLGGREIYRVTEQSVTETGWLMTSRQYLVVDLELDRLEGNHLRVLDDLLDVYGLNITYEVAKVPRNLSCSVVGCSLAGHCYASHDFREFYCACFVGFSGPTCGTGPLCQPATNPCENGATCRQVGATASSCLCPQGFTGSRCEVRLSGQGCLGGEGCSGQCPEDNTGEPCACGLRGQPLNTDRARYEGTLRLSDVTAVRQCLESLTCSLKPSLTKQISKYLRSSNLSLMEDLRVLDVGLSGEVRFHFWGGKSEGSRVRESLNRLVQKGRLGNVSLVATHLAITQEPTLHLQSVEVNQPRARVRQGEEFVLSCIAQGSSHLAFRWFKDGVFINTTRAKRNVWTRLLPLDSVEQYTALLGVERADPLDQGLYTCQVTDWGYQQCKGLALQVSEAPQVRIDPMSITVEKGENVTVKCISPNELQFDSKLGYSWTRNNALFRMAPGEEFWEDLFPGGSLLRIYNVQRSVSYTCHVHGNARSVSRSMRLEVLNQSLVPWCPADETGVGGIRWERAGPGVTAKVECPAHYQGVASRLCLLVEGQQAQWETPDFSDCISDKITSVSNSFHKVTLGFGNTTAMDAVFGVLTSLRDRGVIYPGEGEPAISLLHRVTSYLNETAAWEELANSTNYFYSAVNTLLQHRNSIINHQKVEELRQVMNVWSGLWGNQGGTGSAHLAFDSLVVDLFRYEEPSFRRGLSLRIPRPTFSYPPWFSSRVVLHLESSRGHQNTSSNLGVIVYNRLSDFLPQRYSQTLENGSEVQFEIVSQLVGVVARGPVFVLPSVELAWSGRPGWELRCGVAVTPSSLWNLTVCNSAPLTANHTLCRCPQLGTYAAMVIKVIHTRGQLPRNMSPRIVLVGCACCLVQSLLTLALLLLRWWRHRSCLLFLKIQCCTSIVAAMLIFLYAFSRTVSQSSYPSISTCLQAVMLVSLSSHLSKILLVYTEIAYLPDVRNLKPTVISTVSGVPLLAVLCNHIAQVSLDSRLTSWWLLRGTLVFYSCTTCALVLVVLFVFLHFHVSKRLKSLVCSKSLDTKKAIQRRLGLLNRAGVVFSATMFMATSSVFYINYPNVRCQYLFSLTSALLGFLLLVCYVLHCESPTHLHVLTTGFKLQHPDLPNFSSESSAGLSIFTKQEAEAECEGAPPLPGEDGKAPRTIGKVDPVKEVDPGRDSVLNGLGRSRGVTFKNELFTVSEKVSKDEQSKLQPNHHHLTDMEVYPSSPRKFQKDPPDGVGRTPQLPDPCTTRVCVITSVVVDTPSVVVCSVDVEPCSVLNKSIVCSGEAPSNQSQEKRTESSAVLPETEKKGAEEEDPDQETGADMMDRICHDLDYLLNGVNDPPEESGASNILIQHSSL